MGNVYLLNAFTPNMFIKFPVKVIFDKISKDEFCNKVHLYSQTGDLKVVLNRGPMADLVNVLCGTQVEKNSMRISLNEGDKALIILTKIKLDNDKPPTVEQVRQMYKEGKIELYEAVL
jgi:hypothetical protein